MAFNMKIAFLMALGMYLRINQIDGEKFQEILRTFGDEIKSPIGRGAYYCFFLIALPIYLLYVLVTSMIELFRNGVQVWLCLLVNDEIIAEQ